MIDKAIFRLPGVHRMLGIVLVLAIARALAIVGQALGLANAIVNLWNGAALADQLTYIALFLACFVLRQALLNLQSRMLERYATERAADLRQQLLARVFAEGPALVSQLGSASVTQTVIDGIDDVRIYIGLIIPKIISVVAVPLVLLVTIFPLDWVSGVIALVCYPFIILYMVMIGHTAQDDAAKRHGEFQRMANHFIDGVAGIGELKAFGQSRYYEGRIFAASERFREMTMKTLRIATLSSTVLDMFATLALAGVAVMLGFRLVGGTIAFLPALAVLILVPEYFRPIREFAADYHASLDGRSAFAAIRRVLEADFGGEGDSATSAVPAAPSWPAPVAATSAAPSDSAPVAAMPAADGAVSPAAVSATPADGAPVVPADGAMSPEAVSAAPADGAVSATPALELRGVTFAYPEHPDALRDVSFAVQGPCKVALVGASGSGKSTLMSVLAGFADPASGEITLNGVRVPSLRCAAWQRAASFIPQDPYVFSASLRDNLTFYNPSAGEGEIARAVRMAGLDGLVAELPDGLDTPVGKGARGLSGGQAHRVALARAFLGEGRPVLLLDEPTAHLDIETELELKERMLPLMEGKLVFFATHRLHWLAQMDYVIELEDGRIAWQGSAADWRAQRAGVTGMAGAADAAGAGAGAKPAAGSAAGVAGATPAVGSAAGVAGATCEHRDSREEVGCDD